VVIFEAEVRQKSWAIIQQATTMQSTNLPQPVIGSFNDLRDIPDIPFYFAQCGASAR